jgi:uncharacterized protein
MELLHICVGRTQVHTINNHNVSTAYLKEPVTGPWRIGPDGLEGNEVAVHTDAVYAFARDSYEFWAERLGKQPQEWPPGTFAENLTFDTLNETELYLGDLVALGDEVRLVVTGPRLPCFKLTWRLGQPPSFIREFALSGRTGVYFSVVTPGIVKPGDTLRIIRQRPENPRVTDVSQLVFGDDPPDEALIERVLGVPTLSTTAAGTLRPKLYRARDMSQTRLNRWAGWRKFLIDEVRRETADVFSLTLRADDAAPLASFRGGQFLTVRLPLEAGEDIVRTWSCSDYARYPDRYRLTIKREPRGRASNWLSENARVGMGLDLRAPTGRFVLDRGGFRPLVLIAAGIGVTPMLAMLKAHVERGEGAPPLLFVYCVRDRLQQVHREEIDQLIAQRPGCRVHYVHSVPRREDRLGLDYHQSGRLKAADIQELLKDSHLMNGTKRIDLPWFESDIYLCGPDSFQSQLRNDLIEAGASAERVSFERFTSLKGGGSGAAIERSEVVFARAGHAVTWSAEDDVSLLELAERHGLKPESGCRMGICQACQCKLVEGSVRYDATPLDLPSPDTVLTCVARPASPRVVLDI